MGDLRYFMNNPESVPPPRPWIRTLDEARLYPNSFFFLDCENEIPVTSPVRHVKCTERALEKLCDDLDLYGLLTDATQCIYYDILPSEKSWSKEQLSGDIWIAPEYDGILGPAIRLLLSGEVEDIYNDWFDPTKHFFSNYPKYDLGVTPLYCAAKLGDWDGTFARMLRCSPDINARNTDGDTPLHGAASSGHATFVERLLSLGSDVTAKGAQGRTPLHVAIFNLDCKHPPPIDAARLLIRSNANVNAFDNYGVSPLDYLFRWCPEQVVLKEMLVAYGAKIAKEIQK